MKETGLESIFERTDQGDTDGSEDCSFRECECESCDNCEGCDCDNPCYDQGGWN